MVLASFNVQAQDGVLVFHGHVVNSTCTVNQSGRTDALQPVFKVQVHPGLFLDVNTQANVCSGEAVPFTTHYQAVRKVSVNDVQPTRTGPSSAMGVVTVSYQ